MKFKIAPFVVGVAIFCIVEPFRATAQSTGPKPIVVADFNKRDNLTRSGDAFGTWNKDPNDGTQGCKMSFANDDALGSKDGMSIKLVYDVDSPRPAFNGFWLKLENVSIGEANLLSFYVRGDPTDGFTHDIKVEIKQKKGELHSYTIHNISPEWQKISVPLKVSSSDKKPLAEFTIVFDDQTSIPKTGTILIDEIEISKAIDQ